MCGVYFWRRITSNLWRDRLTSPKVPSRNPRDHPHRILYIASLWWTSPTLYRKLGVCQGYKENRPSSGSHKWRNIRNRCNKRDNPKRISRNPLWHLRWFVHKSLEVKDEHNVSAGIVHVSPLYTVFLKTYPKPPREQFPEFNFLESIVYLHPLVPELPHHLPTSPAWINLNELPILRCYQNDP